MVAFKQQDVARLIWRFYEAALDEQLWPGTIQQFLRITGFGKVFMGVINDKTGDFIYGQQINWSPEALREYLLEIYKSDPKVDYLITHPHTRILYDYLYTTENKMDGHAYYEWCRRAGDGVRYHIAGVGRPMASDLRVVFTQHRSVKQGHAQDKDLELFNFLFVHIERALQVSFRLGQSAAMTNASLQALDTHPLA